MVPLERHEQGSAGEAIKEKRPCRNFLFRVLHTWDRLTVLVIVGDGGKVVAALTVHFVVKAWMVRLEVFARPLQNIDGQA